MIIIRKVEEFKALMDKCPSMFENFSFVGNHCNVFPYNGFFVFGDVDELEIPDDSLDEEININVSAEPPRCFFDFQFRTEHILFNVKPAGVYIYVNNQLLAYYNSDMNLLLMSDISHTKECVEFFKINLEKKFLEILKKYSPQSKVKFNLGDYITLGCDPEFELVYNGEVLSAKNVDPIDIYTNEGNVGVDGAGDQIEIRPAASKTPQKVINNLKTLIAKIREQEDIDLITDGDNYPLGGHIHIGSESLDNFIKSHQRTFVEAYDLVLGEFLNFSGDARGGYKALGQYEEKNYGLEYRSLPAAMFYTPKAALYTFAIMKVITYQVLMRLLKEEPMPTNKKEALEMFKIKKLYLKLKTTMGEYRKNISLFSAWLENRHEEILVVEFRDAWEILTMRKVKEVLKQLKINKPIVFYGLKKERGNVYSYDKNLGNLLGYQWINHPVALEENRVRIGLPHELRIDPEKVQITIELVKTILEEIEKCV